MYIQFDDDYAAEERSGRDGPYVSHDQSMAVFFPLDPGRFPLNFRCRVPEGGYDPEKVYRLSKKSFKGDERGQISMGKYIDVVECTQAEADWLRSAPKPGAASQTGPKAVKT